MNVLVFSWKKKILDHKNPQFLDVEQIKTGRNGIFRTIIFLILEIFSIETETHINRVDPIISEISF